MTMDKVGFIGCRQAGIVARQVLKMGNAELKIWQPDGDEEVDAEELPGELVELEALAEIPLIVFSTGVDRCRKVARRLGDIITGRHIVVHTVRGVEPGTLNTASRILHQETATRRIGFVTGPMKLEDLQAERPASAVCASHFPEVHDLVEEAMMSPRFRVYHSRDLIGAELSAVYSRLIALMSGLADGLEFGDSLQAMLFARGLAEMARFVVARDGYERTAFGLSGAGNLHADTLGGGSIDFQMGHHLARAADETPRDLVDAFGQRAQEVLDILTAFAEVNEQTSLELHFLEAAHAILHAQIPPAEVVKSLMTLPALYE